VVANLSAASHGACSWCGKSVPAAQYVVAGPGSNKICDECVELCNDILSSSLETWRWRPSPRLVVTTEDVELLVAAFEALGRAVHELEEVDPVRTQKLRAAVSRLSPLIERVTS
jgi:hypothetical protein